MNTYEAAAAAHEAELREIRAEVFAAFHGKAPCLGCNDDGWIGGYRRGDWYRQPCPMCNLNEGEGA